MWILPEQFTESALRLRHGWLENEQAMLAPMLFRAEVTSVIRERAFRDEISTSEARDALAISFQWPIALRDGGDALQRAAFDVATRFDRPKAYDAQYVALAALLGCELWTGDRRFINSLRGELPWVKWIGDYQPS